MLLDNKIQILTCVQSGDMIRLTVVKSKYFYYMKQQYLESTHSEHSNDMSNDTKSYLHQKILIVDEFPGTYLIANVSIIIDATAVIKYFFESTLKEEAIDICC